MRPNATAAAEAISASASFSFFTSPPTAFGSRRTAMELMTPMSNLPFSLPIALRSAASAAASGIASRAIRAHDANCWSDNKGASTGTASFVP